MAKNLVIVESPAKAKTINKYLGKDYIVKASMGHVRDLPQKRLGIDIENSFEPKYVPLSSKRKIIQELKKAVKDVDKVFLAPDLDREGEAIAWHLVQVLKVPLEKVYRVTFNQITKAAIQEAFNNPGKIRMDKVYAQQARRILDRLVGYKLSPLLWKKVTKGLSAGRVQSVAVKLISEREKEIQEFKPQEYWRVLGKFFHSERKDEIEAGLKKLDGQVVDEEPYAITNEEQAKELVDHLSREKFTVKKVDVKVREEKPEPPFITSTLQQRASIQLQFSSKKTMLIAQQLYEGLEVGGEGQIGLITYMRTDSVVVAPGALEECRGYIKDNFKPGYLPAKANKYSKGKRAQEAHECIRPTSVELTPANMKQFLTQDQWKLYKIIWERYVASQMMSAQIENTAADIAAAKAIFRASGRRIIFDGYRKVWKRKGNDEDRIIPEIKEGESLELDNLSPSQHFTQPPPRYTEALLIRTLEREGIGRPSTYATIISTIQDRGYVQHQQRKFSCTDLGMLVTEKLVNHFPRILDTEFTSKMETELDEIEEAKLAWVQVLEEFYRIFEANLEKAEVEMVSEKGEKSATDEICELCSEKMVIRWSRRGKFLGCSGYPECKNIKSLDEDGNVVPQEASNEVCSECGEAMVIRSGRTGRFLACSAYPDCKNTKSLPGADNEIKAVEFDCQKCGKPMVVKHSRRGTFYACSGYPDCRNTVPMEKEGKPIVMEDVDEKCEKCNGDMILKWSRYRKSKFLACSAYPKCKNTKPYSKDGKNKEKSKAHE
ncbi:type I DNA topoisomerase [Planctomycetota bacterium]